MKITVKQLISGWLFSCFISNLFACGDSNLSLISTTDNGNGTFTISMELCVASGVTGVTYGAQGNTSSFGFAIYSTNPIIASSFYPATLPTVYSGETGFGELTGGIPFAPFSEQENLVYNFDYCSQPYYGCIFSTILCGNIQINCQQFDITLNAVPDSIRALGIEGSGNFDGSCNGPELLIDFSAIPLNVTWNSITANLLNNNEVIISWETESEVNNDYFEVQKRVGTSSIWRTIAAVNGNGTSSLNHYYSCIDEEFRNELTYYRIQQTDFDGKKTWSKIVTVLKYGEYDYLLFPNPASNNVTISNVKDARILLFSLNGKLIQEFYSHFNEYQFEVSILDNGIYFIELLKGKELQREMLIIQH